MGSIFYIVSFLATLMAFRGQGSHAVLVGAVLMAFAIASVSRHFRNQCGDFFRTQKRALHDHRPWRRLRASFWLVGLPTALLCLANGRNLSSFDNYGAVMTAGSLVQFQTTELSQSVGGPKSATECKEAYWLICLPNGIYSAYPVGMAIAALPVFAVARLAGADLTNHGVLWHLAKWSAAGFAALTAMFIFLIALNLGYPQAAVWVTLFTSSGSAVFSTIGQGLWSHDLVTLALVIGVFVVLEKPSLSFPRALLVGLCWSLMIAGRLTALVLVVVFLAWLLWRDRRAALVACVACGIGLLPWLAYNRAIYGHWAGPQFLMSQNLPGGFALQHFPEGFYGLLLSPGTGLLIYQPWVLVVLIGFAQWQRKRSDTLRGTPFFSAMVLAQLLLMSSWAGWTGQWCWGTRYLTESMPFLALLALPGVEKLRKSLSGRRWLRMFAGLSLLVQLNGTYGPGSGWVHEAPTVWAARPEPDPLRLRMINRRCLDWGDPAFLYPLYQRLFPPVRVTP